MHPTVGPEYTGSDFFKHGIVQGVQGGQPVRPRVMVCLSRSPSNRRVIRAAAKLASAYGPVPTARNVQDAQSEGSAQSSGSACRTVPPARSPQSGGSARPVQPPSSAHGPVPTARDAQDAQSEGSLGTVQPSASASAPAQAPIALYVGSTGREAEQDSRLRENILLAMRCGFEIHTVQSNDITLAISEYAARAGVTDLFLGYSPPPFVFQTKPAINEQLLRRLPSVDIHIIPDQASSSFPGTMQVLKKDGFGISWNLPDILRVLGIMAVATLLSAWFYQSRYSNANIITIYLLAVLIASVMTSSRIYGLFAAILYVLLFNFLFIDPRYTLLVYDSTYMMTYLVTMAAALITGTVAVRMKNIAHISAENAYQAKILLDTSNQLEMADGQEAILQTTCMQLVHLLNRAVLFLPPDCGDDLREKTGLPGSGEGATGKTGPPGAGDGAMEKTGLPGSGDGTLENRAAQSAEKDPSGSGEGLRVSPKGTYSRWSLRDCNKNEQEAVRWTMENTRRAGAFTPHFPECASQYLCVYTGTSQFGVIGIEMEGRPFTDFENTILLSILHECTMALENTRMEQERKNAEIQAENERLRAGLLRSLSHDLRTPLTSIYGNASNLRSYEKDLPRSERDKIYEDIMEDADWLNIQFENILSMTKLENVSSGNGNSLQMTVENMEDVIEESLRHIAAHPAHRIVFEQTDQLLFARMDPKLIMQVLINLLNNAVKYTPPGSTIRVRAMQDSLPDALAKSDQRAAISGSPREPLQDPAPAIESRILVEVADNGPGIPDEDKPHVFELFYTGRHALEDSYRSMGIGLNLCAQIIRAHAGTIEAADNDPCGAVFRFRLPSAEISLSETQEI